MPKVDESYWFDPEVQVHQRKYETFQILHQIKENSQTFRIFILLYFRIWTYLWCLESHLLLSYSNHKFLLPYLIRFGPLSVLTVENSAFNDDSFHLINDSLGNIRYDSLIYTLFSDKLITFILWIVVVLEFSSRIYLKIKEFMTVGPTMTNAE